MQVTHYFDASLTSPVITTIPAMQGDGIRLLVARLKEGTKPWPVPEGISAGLSYELPDRVPGYYDRLNDGTPACTINGDQVSVVLDPILTERPGPVKASIILRDPDGIQVATFPFHIWVKRVPGMVHGENLEAPAHIFDGKIYYGGPGGALLPLGLGAGIRTEKLKDGSILLVGDAVEDHQKTTELPDYWLEHLAEKIPAINTAMETAGRNKSAFFFYTDGHRISSANMTPAILRYLYRHTSIQKTNNGGDFFEPFATGSDNLAQMRGYMADIRDIPNHHSVIGNHDEDNEALTSDQQMYGFYHAWEEGNDVVWGGYHYYYIDNKAEQTRYLYLDTGKFAVSDGEMQFLIDALTGTPEGWHIVALSHIWYDYSVSAIPDYVQHILDVFDAYNFRWAGSVTHNGTAFAYDFRECLGTVEFCIGGHNHADKLYYSTGGIPIIHTDTDSFTRKSESQAVAGTITEGCIDAVVADYDAKKIHLIRIGRGSDRTVAIPDYVPPSDEVINILETADIQYNARWSSSSRSYKGCNGVIAFAIPWADVWGKTIYFKGFSNVTDNATRSQWIIVKDSNTAEVAGFRDCDNYNIFTSSRLQENDGVYSITVDAGAIGWAEFNDSDRLQIQMVLNSGTAVSAADIAGCVMIIGQPIMTAP